MSDLFDGEYTQDTAAVEALERLQERQLTDVRYGIHPLTRRSDIHGRADLDASPLDPPDLPLRCGTCAHREKGRWPKCKVNHRDFTSETTVAAWWPACTSYVEAS